MHAIWSAWQKEPCLELPRREVLHQTVGDYVIALSVCPDNLVQEEGALYTSSVLHNGDMSPLFLATIEATAEALWNSLFMARTTKGYEGKIVPQIPVDEVVKMLKQSRYFEQTLNITK